MPDQLITCPNCGTEFEVGDVLTDSIRAQLKAELEADLVKKQENVTKRLNEAKRLEEELAKRAESIDDAVSERLDEERKKVAATERKRVEQELKGQLTDLQEQIDERGKKLEEAAKREAELRKQQRELEEKEKSLELEIENRLDEGRKQIAETAKKQAEESFARKNREAEEKLTGLQEQLDEQTKKLDDAHKKEVDFLRKERELQEKERSMDLELERKLTEAQGKLHEEAMKKAQEAQQLKMREKDDLIERLKGEMQQLQRRMEQGSQESQGEALEGQLQDTLSATFPFDQFDEVKKGARGADILQTVRDKQGRVCGTILWEAKNARAFQPKWVEKLKQDQMEAGATIAVLMTLALPPGMQLFGQLEDGGIWVTDYASAVCLCAALRQQLMLVAREKVMVEHRDTVKDALFEYVTGQEFTMRVRAIADTYIQMQTDLASEKRVFQRVWKKREKQIAKVLDNITCMHGELEGVVGAQSALSDAGPLSLDHLAPEEDDEDAESEETTYEETEEVDDETEYEDTEEGDESNEEDEVEEAPAKDPGKWWEK